MDFTALGEPPTPEGSWVDEAVYISAAALKTRTDPYALAAKIPGAEVLPSGLIRIVVERPGELLDQPFEQLDDQGWPDFPRTWENPGFVVRYAATRAANTQRWAGELQVPLEPFQPELLDGPWDRKVLRVLAELPGRRHNADLESRRHNADLESRRRSREPGWGAYLVRLATAYHDAHELAPAVPKGDEPIKRLHTARLRLAQAVQKVLPATNPL